MRTINAALAIIVIALFLACIAFAPSTFATIFGVFSLVVMTGVLALGSLAVVVIDRQRAAL